METQNPEDYEEIALEWQYHMICQLKESLEKHGVDRAQARDIVGDFARSFGRFQDDGEVRFDGKEYRPLLAFDDHNGHLLVSESPSHFSENAYTSTNEAFH